MLKRLFILIIILAFSIPCFGAQNINISYNDGIYHIILKGEKIKKRIKFVSSESLITNQEAHKNFRSKLTVNTGYFDPSNQKTISYIVTNRETVEDPVFNENIYKNPVLRNNIDKILNRTEFRIVECSGKLHYEIVPHKDSVDFGCNIVTSAQAGPLVYPDLRMEEEFFVVKNGDTVVRESCSVLHKTSRTVIGLKNGEAHILIITDKHPMDLYEVHDYIKELGFDRAMTFDGGSSTSMNYLNKYNVISTKGDGAGRILKSFMIVK